MHKLIGCICVVTHEKEDEAAAVLDALRESAHVDGGQIINLMIGHAISNRPRQQTKVYERTSKNPSSPWLVRKSFVMIAFCEKEPTMIAKTAATGSRKVPGFPLRCHASNGSCDG